MKTAQEAYQEALKNIAVDTTPVMEAAEKAIEYAIANGQLATIIGSFPLNMAEKGAIELERYGYVASTQYSGKFKEDGSPLINIVMNFKYLPQPSRESYV